MCTLCMCHDSIASYYDRVQLKMRIGPFFYLRLFSLSNDQKNYRFNVLFMGKWANANYCVQSNFPIMETLINEFVKSIHIRNGRKRQKWAMKKSQNY